GIQAGSFLSLFQSLVGTPGLSQNFRELYADRRAAFVQIGCLLHLRQCPGEIALVFKPFRKRIVIVATGAVLLDLALKGLVDVNGFSGRWPLLRSGSEQAKTEGQQEGKDLAGRRADVQYHNLLYFLTFTIRQPRIMAQRSRGCQTGMNVCDGNCLSSVGGGPGEETVR